MVTQFHSAVCSLYRTLVMHDCCLVLHGHVLPPLVGAEHLGNRDILHTFVYHIPRNPLPSPLQVLTEFIYIPGSWGPAGSGHTALSPFLQAESLHALALAGTLFLRCLCRTHSPSLIRLLLKCHFLQEACPLTSNGTTFNLNVVKPREESWRNRANICHFMRN